MIGNVPPPFGGVSVHTGRLASYAGAKGWRVRVFDFSKREKFRFAENVMGYPLGVHNPFALLRILCSRSIIHVEGSPWYLLCFFGFLGLLGRKVVFSTHTSTWILVRFSDESKIKKWLFRLCCLGFSYVIVPHKWLRRCVLSLSLPFKNVVTLGAFIVQIPKHEDYEAISNEVWDFIKGHNPVLGGYAYRLNLKDGIDVYGLDLLVSLVHNLKDSNFPNCGLVFVLPKAGNYVYFNEIKQLIKTLNVEEHVLFVHGEREAYPIWSHLDVFVRPTCTDGDAITVRECLYIGVSVVASDCVERPRGVVTFKNRDLTDLENKVRMVLNNIEKYRIKDCGCFADRYMSLYEELIK